MEWFEIYLFGLFFSLILTVALFSNDTLYGFDGKWNRRLLFVAMCLGSFVTLIFVAFIIVYAVSAYLIEGYNRKKRGL